MEPARAEEQGRALFIRYFQQGDRAALDQAIDLFGQAAAGSSAHEAGRVTRLALLGEALRSRYALTHQRRDLDQALAAGSEAVAAADLSVPGSSDLVRALAYTHLAAYDGEQRLDDLDAARDAFARALAVSVRNSAAQLDLMTDLVETGCRRYDVTRDPLDLQEAVELANRASRRATGRAPWHLRALVAAGVAHGLRYSRFRMTEDLLQQVGVLAAAAEIAGPGSPDRVDILLQLGTARRHLGRWDEAIQTLEAAAGEARAIAGARSAAPAAKEESRLLARALDSLANGYATRPHADAAADLARAVELTTAARGLVDAADPEWGVSTNNLAVNHKDRYVLEGDGAQLDAAIEVWREAVALGRGDLREILPSLASALRHRAAIHPDAEALVEAETCYRDARVRLEEHLHGLPVSQRLVEEKYRDRLIQHQVGVLLELGRPAEALVAAGSGQAGLLGEALRRLPLPAPAGVAGELLAREQQLLDDLDIRDAMELAAETAPHSSLLVGDMALRITEEPGLGLIHADSSVRAKMSLRRDYQEQLEELWARIGATGEPGRQYADFRRGADLAWPGLRAVAARLDAAVVLAGLAHRASSASLDGTVEVVLFSYVSSSPQPAVSWTGITGDLADDLQGRVGRELARYDPAAPRSQTWDHRLRPAMAAAAQSVAAAVVAAAGASATKAAPLAGRLLVSPAMSVPAVPWAVLAGRGGWLSPAGGPLPVTTVPSVAMLSQRPPRTALPAPRVTVLSHPAGDLPHAASEAAAVAQVWGAGLVTDDAATCEAGLAALAGSDVVHFACHGYYRADNPFQSAIRLADGDLRAAGLLNRQAGVELLVLSACETGVAKALPGGEAAGLAIAFLRAGVRSVVVSLWPVDDESTSVLMRGFHSRVHQGWALDSALRAAAAAVAADSRWSHPYYWGSFVLIGDPAPLTKAEPGHAAAQ